MAHAHCPYCGGQEGRCTPSGAGRYITECKSCARVVDERRVEVQELFVERATDSPLCIVTPDFSDKVAPLEDDPFESSGFITAFSTWSLELTPLFTNTTSTVSGHLAELERVMAEYYPNGGANLAGSLNLVDMLRAYFQIVEVSSVLGLERDSSEHAIQLFRDCSTTTYLRNRNIEALATAALVQASREAQEPRTLQEISAAANIPQKEIARHMKLLSDALKLSQPINSNSISVHMPRFCNLLQLNKTTQDLASHIGEVVISKSFCTRRNPISISAAAIYLACQLEDKRKTQTEICKATGLTEVTLRKVYKELLENLDDLLPKGYTPAVPPEKAFPVSTALRVSGTRVTPSTSSITPSIASIVLESGSHSSGMTTGSPAIMHGAVSVSSSGSLFRMPSGSHMPHIRPSSGRPAGGNVFMMPPTMSSSVTPIPFLSVSAAEAKKNAVETSLKETERSGLRRDKLDVDLNTCGDPSSPSPSPRATSTVPSSFGGLNPSGYAQPTPLASARIEGTGRRASLHDLNMVPSMDDNADDVVEIDMFQSTGKRPPGPDLNGVPHGVFYDGNTKELKVDAMSQGFPQGSSFGAFNAVAAAIAASTGGRSVPFPGFWGLGSTTVQPFGLFPQQSHAAENAREGENKGLADTVTQSAPAWAPAVQNPFFAVASASDEKHQELTSTSTVVTNIVVPFTQQEDRHG